MVPSTPRRRKVLIARPNDFLVDAMRGAVERAGFEAVALRSLEDLPVMRTGEFAGAVISSAVTSSVSESIGEVFTAIRAKHPRLPMAVATMLADRRAIDERLHSELPKTLRTAGLDGQATTHRLGDPEVLLVLRQQDLGGGDSVVAALRSHFGGDGQ